MYLPKHWNYWETFTPWFFLILMAIMFLGCGQSPEDRFKALSRDDCFRLGGTRYEAGESNGNVHSVCIYEKK